MQSKSCLVIILMGFWILLALAGCARQAPSVAQATPTPVALSQWAVSATASSEFGFPDWSANRATGAPEINACADDSRAWASTRGSGLEWLELHYEQPVYATEVRVYQTFGRGAVARILLVDEGGTGHLAWEGTDAGPCPGILAVSFPRTAFRVFGVRIDLDESRTGFWNQVDAVALIGIR